MCTVFVWGIKFDLLTKNQIVDRVQKMLSSGKKGIQLTGVNPETVVNSTKIPILRESILGSDIVNVDNMLVLLRLRRLGFDVPERAATPDVFMMLLQNAQQNGQSVYFLGAEQIVIEKMVGNVKSLFPELKVAGYRNGFFTDSEEDSIVSEIKSASPSYLFLGLPTPQKESFILRHKAELGVGVLYGVGGAFDVLGEKVGRAPQWICNIGLEGFFRVLQKPSNYGKRLLKYYPEFIKLSSKI